VRGDRGFHAKDSGGPPLAIRGRPSDPKGWWAMKTSLKYLILTGAALAAAVVIDAGLWLGGIVGV